MTFGIQLDNEGAMVTHVNGNGKSAYVRIGKDRKPCMTCCIKAVYRLGLVAHEAVVLELRNQILAKLTA